MIETIFPEQKHFAQIAYHMQILLKISKANSMAYIVTKDIIQCLRFILY